MPFGTLALRITSMTSPVLGALLLKERVKAGGGGSCCALTVGRNMLKHKNMQNNLTLFIVVYMLTKIWCKKLSANYF
jgi:hypothetical protein